jgi:uncharacterized membrane protein YeaQ/YmgE (transglycosylase-associated protein family)
VSNIIWIIVIGFVAGIIGRFLSPGPNRPNGFILTTGLGIAGAFVATFIGQTIGWYRLRPGRGSHRRDRRRGARAVHLEPAGGPPHYVRSRQPAPRPQHAAAPLALGIFKERAREVRPMGLQAFRQATDNMKAAFRRQTWDCAISSRA